MGPSPLILPLFPRSRGRPTSPQLLSGIAGSDEVFPEPPLLHTQPSHLPQPPLRTPAPRTVSVGVPQSRARRAGRQQRFLQRAGRDVSGCKRASCVAVLGVGHGNKLLSHLYNCHLSKVYTVGGQFGKATEDFSNTGKLIEKTTFGKKLNRCV
uniref:Uncharacterized protein n=1 Tax=Meleagris gallopavo TaxID=9103 RepID=G1MXP2_MELGA